ncbi:DUF802 domain-containing protein [Rhodocyclus purpureus]|uniref:DUF802 domain-containing protein n=1 Tax=Rhodocyclus purpureus TaxID=1067 RepID=UPI00191400E4|nr:DUF802 domain-containing protein [Rhodocyclus purpureus]MBK5915060.1 hypothetical protein [Rhodocyclus purpureus]
MNRTISLSAFALGLLAVAWVGSGYIGSSPLALGMTAIIGAVYVAGALELLRFSQATSALARALAAIPDDLSNLADWLGQLPPSLQNSVRLRIDGERVGLPGPALTPYLVGLLVLLGMLGTFLGMVLTLNGAVIALESSTDLQAIRASLAAPVKGLGVAFGTSVAGVAASAMLGLISALCRRERQQAAQVLDMRIARDLRGFSLSHQRAEAYRALQMQAQGLPEVVNQLQAMMAQMEAQGRQLNDRLLANQESHYLDAKGLYSDLASAVGRSLQESLSESARIAGATIQPAVEAALDGIARETNSLQEKLADTVRTQLDGLAERFGTTVGAVSETWTRALEQQERSNQNLNRRLQDALAAFTDTFAQRSESLLATLRDAHAGWQSESAAQDRQRLQAMSEALAATAAMLQRQWQEVEAQTREQHEHLLQTLAQTARDIGAEAQARSSRTIDEVARLLQTVAEAPRAAAAVIGELRQELGASIVRDQEQLAERARIMATLSGLLDAINRGTGEQQAAIEALVASSSELLDRVGARHAETLAAESARLSGVAAQLGGSAVEVASLSEAFALSVQLFSEANERLTTTLQRIEGTLDKSMARSDDQLAYYVAQAREIIDLCIMSQQRIVDDRQRLSAPTASTAGEV